MEFPLFQLAPSASFPVIGNPWEDPDSISFTTLQHHIQKTHLSFLFSRQNSHNFLLLSLYDTLMHSTSLYSIA